MLKTTVHLWPIQSPLVNQARLGALSSAILILALNLVIVACSRSVTVGGESITSLRPAATLAGFDPSLKALYSNAPASASTDQVLHVKVSGDKITQYRKKIGPAGSTDCSKSDGYATAQKTSVLITDSLSRLPNGNLRLCLIGGTQSGIWQLTSKATIYTWAKTSATQAVSTSSTSKESSTSVAGASATPTNTVAADTTPPVPGNSGTIVAGSVTGTSLSLTWTAATDDTTAAENLQYTVYQSITNNIDSVSAATSNGTVIQSYTANTTNLAVSGLTTANTYYFNVLVKDEAGNVAAYTSVSQATSVDSPPTAGNSGTISAASVADSGLTLNWTLATDDITSQANLQYAVYSSLSNNISGTNAATNGTLLKAYSANYATFAVTGLTPATTYYFNVLVKDGAGNVTPYTSLAQATAADTTAPTAGGNLAVGSTTDSSIALSWTAGSDDVTPAASLKYQVYYKTTSMANTVVGVEGGTAFGSLSTNLTSTTVTGLSAANTYYFNVEIQDAAGNKAVYATVSGSTAVDTTPPTPGGNLATGAVTDSSIALSWTAGSDDITAAASLKYQVYYKTTSMANTVAGVEGGTSFGSLSTNITSATVTGLTPSTTYYFNVEIQDATGNKAVYTTVSTATTADTTAPTPGGSLATGATTDSSIALSWVAGSDDVTAAASLKYQVYYKLSSMANSVAGVEGGTTFGSLSTNITSTTVTGLTPSTTYYFNVEIQDAAGNKAVYTTVNTATAADTTAPTAGGNLATGTVTSSSVALSWSAGSDDVTAAASLKYQVYYSGSNMVNTVGGVEGGTAFGSLTTNLTSTTVTGLTPTDTYYFNVEVQDAAGNKAVYSTVSATAVTDTTPPTPGGNLATGATTDSSVALSWTAGTDDITAQASLRYRVYYSQSTMANTTGGVEAGTAFGSLSTNMTSATVTGLTPSTTYYFNVEIEDGAGNKAVYSTVNTATAADTTAPTAGGSLATGATTDSSVALTWAAGSDDVTATASLKYQVYYKGSTMANTVVGVEGGTAFGSLSTNITSATVTGLSPSTTYYFNVEIQDAAGNKAVYTTVNTATAADTTAPTAGGNLATGATTDSSIALSWTAGSDDTTATASLNYQVYYKISTMANTVAGVEGGTTFGGLSTNITTATVTGLSPSTTYFFNVEIQDAAGNKAVYATVSAATAVDTTAPTAGGSLATGATTDSSVALTWAAGSDDTTATASLKYQVYYKTTTMANTIAGVEGGTSFGSLTTNITAATVTGLLPSTTYYFNVEIQDAAGNKAVYSTVNAATVADTTAPTAGGSLATGATTDSTIALSWTAGSDDVTATASLKYQIYYKGSTMANTVAGVEGGTAFGSLTTNITAATVTSLSPSTTYYFNVEIQDAAGNKAVYATVSAATATDTTAPVAGGSLATGSTTDSSIALSWAAGSDDTTATASLNYQVYYKTTTMANTVAGVEGGTTFGSLTTNITAATVTGLSPSTTYYFNVEIQDAAGNKAVYATVSAATVGDTTAPTPGGSLATGATTDSTIALSWVAGTDDITAAASLKYQVYYKTTSMANTVAGVEGGTSFGSLSTNITSATVTGLTPSTTYYFNVEIQDAAGNKAVYTTVSTATAADTTAPTVGNSGTITTASVAATTLTLNWTAATDDITAQSSLQYAVYQSNSNNLTGVTNTQNNGGTAINGGYSTNITTYNVTGLTANSTYYFNVLVKDAAGNVAAYTSVSQLTLCAAPTGGSAAAGDSQNVLSWTTNGATSYNIYWQTSSGVTTSSNKISGQVPSYTHSSLTDGTTYYYKISAVNGTGESSLSSEFSGEPVAPTAPPAPTGLTATADGTRIQLAWTTGGGTTAGFVLVRNPSSSVTFSPSNSTGYSTGAQTGGTIIYVGTSTSKIMDSGLTGGTTYYYAVFAYDSSNIYSTSATANRAASSSTTWTWVSGNNTVSASPTYGTKGTAATANVPGQLESLNMGLTDSQNNFWVFGGDNGTNLFNTLWKFDGANWTWVSGKNGISGAGTWGTKGTPAAANVPPALEVSAKAIDSSDNIFIFGGDTNSFYCNTLWKFDGTNWTYLSGASNCSSTPGGTWGVQGTPAAANTPSGRSNLPAAMDSSNHLWIFGGYDGNFHGDLWKWDGVNWTWVSGSNSSQGSSYAGVYGTQGTPAAANHPGSRAGACMNFDASGNLWLFGGGAFNDLWKWDGVNWTWMKGNNGFIDYGEWGTKGTAASSNNPSSRQDMSCWMDKTNNNFYIFGGDLVYDATGNDTSTGGNLNDLWKYDITNNEWTWVAGSNVHSSGSAGVYGTKGTASSSNYPGFRGESATFFDSTGHLWLFGGTGYDSGNSSGNLNDLWKYSP